MADKDADWHLARRLGIGGSDANILMGGDNERILKLWRVKRGDAPDDDLSGVLPVRMGQWTEPFNVQWFEEQTGNVVTGQGDMRVSAEYPFMRCTLDGETTFEGVKAVFEAKHVSAFAKEDEIKQRYYPQLQHCMSVCDYPLSILSVFFGTLTWRHYVVPADALYQAQLIAAERNFWRCVETGELPVVQHIKQPVEPIRMVDMTGNNQWAVHAHLWVSNSVQAKAFKTASESLKGLVDDDVIEASGHGVCVKRNKAGSLTISEVKQ